MNRIDARRLFFFALVALTASGCGTRHSASPADSAASATTTTFFTALINEDWPAAYQALHPGERARLTLEQFTGRAANYRQNLIFTPKSVVIRSCEEHGDTATAHITITARDSRHHQFRDAVTLRRGVAWGVVLSPTFGESRRN
jgi:hypothetical protein